MGREIRRVPPNWAHPVDDRGEFIPMYNETFSHAAKEWKDSLLAWERGDRDKYFHASEYPEDFQFWEWEGNPPSRENYLPEFTEEPTWYQVYETVTEGTPCSPPFATQEELVIYLMTKGGLDRNRYPDLFPLLTRKQAEAFVKCEYAPSMVIDNTGIHSGIECCPD